MSAASAFVGRIISISGRKGVVSRVREGVKMEGASHTCSQSKRARKRSKWAVQINATAPDTYSDVSGHLSVIGPKAGLSLSRI